MFRNKLSAILMSVFLGIGVMACGNVEEEEIINEEDGKGDSVTQRDVNEESSVQWEVPFCPITTSSKGNTFSSICNHQIGPLLEETLRRSFLNQPLCFTKGKKITTFSLVDVATGSKVSEPEKTIEEFFEILTPGIACDSFTRPTPKSILLSKEVMSVHLDEVENKKLFLNGKQVGRLPFFISLDDHRSIATRNYTLTELCTGSSSSLCNIVTTDAGDLCVDFSKDNSRKYQVGLNGECEPIAQ